MWKVDTTITTLGVAAVLALGISTLVTYLPHNAERAARSGSSTASSGTAAQSAAVAARWDASAPGRVAPKGGEIRVRPEASGVVTTVYAKVNDSVRKGDLLAVIESDEVVARLSAARAEVQVRLSERDEEPETDKDLLAWREVVDALGAAERALHAARVAFDEKFLARRDGNASDDDVEKARQAITAAKAEVAERRKAKQEALAKDDLPLISRLDSGLTLARSDLTLAELAYDNTRIRATADGVILQLEMTPGEVTGPSVTAPVAVIGDTSQLEVTAEVEERDIRKIRVGQTVVVRANAFGDQDFPGKVTHIAPRVGSPGLGLRGPSKPRDVEILEVEIVLDGNPPLLSGMRVDVFFKPQKGIKAAAKD